MDAVSSLHVPGSVDGQGAARAGLDAFLAAQGLAPAVTWRFQVAFDEVLSNIVKYARTTAGPPAQVEVQMRLFGDSLEVVVIDDAVAFNPLEAPRPDVSQPIETRTVGGLGLVLVTSLMDAVEYERRATGTGCS